MNHNTQSATAVLERPLVSSERLHINIIETSQLGDENARMLKDPDNNVYGIFGAERTGTIDHAPDIAPITAQLVHDTFDRVEASPESEELVVRLESTKMLEALSVAEGIIDATTDNGTEGIAVMRQFEFEGATYGVWGTIGGKISINNANGHNETVGIPEVYDPAEQIQSPSGKILVGILKLEDGDIVTLSTANETNEPTSLTFEVSEQTHSYQTTAQPFDITDVEQILAADTSHNSNLARVQKQAMNNFVEFQHAIANHDTDKIEYLQQVLSGRARMYHEIDGTRQAMFGQKSPREMRLLDEAVAVELDRESAKSSEIHQTDKKVRKFLGKTAISGLKTAVRTARGGQKAVKTIGRQVGSGAEKIAKKSVEKAQDLADLIGDEKDYRLEQLSALASDIGAVALNGQELYDYRDGVESLLSDQENRKNKIRKKVLSTGSVTINVSKKD